MKKLLPLLAVLLLLAATHSHSQTVYSGYLEEGFESATFPPTDWQRVNVAGTNQWARSTAQKRTGTASALIQYQTTVAEDWLITPQFTVGAVTDSITFWMRLAYQGYPPDSLAIKVSTTDALPSSFTTTLLYLREGLNYPPNATTWVRYKASLQNYVGQNIYLAFKHYNNNGDGLYIDDVTIGTKPAAEVQVVSINGSAIAAVGIGYSPQITVRNNGSATQSFSVGLTSTDGYSATEAVTGLTPGATQLVTFPNWTPAATGPVTFTAVASLAGDANLANNTVTKSINVLGSFPNNGWSAKTAMPSGRWAHGLISKTNATFDTASLYAVTGYNTAFANEAAVSNFNGRTEVWATMAPIPVSRGQVSAQIIGNKIYVAGGYANSFSPTNRLDIYDIATNTWTTGATMPTAVGDYASGVYADSLLYIIGGYSGSSDVNTVQVYNTKTNTWATATAKTTIAVAGGRGAIANGKIIVAGGYNQTSLSQAVAVMGEINAADPYQITWTTLPDYPGGTASRLGAGALFDRVYFTGGDPNGQGTAVLSSTFAYNTATNQWETGPAKISGVSNIMDFTPVLQNGTAYMVALGGYNGISVIGANEWLDLGSYCNLSATSSVTPATCFGGTNATATVSVTGGRGALTYSWATSPVQTTPTATGLAAGTYTVTITDSYYCTITEAITVAEPAPLTGTVSAQTDASCGGADGSATISMSNGTAPYTYAWSPSGGTSATATGLNAGAYSVAVTDANGCAATVNVTINQPTALAVSASNNGTINAGGLLLLTAAGGSFYSWSGPNGFTSTEQNPVIATADPSYAGAYTVTATNGFCTGSATTTVAMVTPGNLSGTYTINQNAPASSTNFTTFNGAAYALNTAGITGPVTINVVAGSGPYVQNQLWLAEMPGSGTANSVTINGNGQAIDFCGSAATSRDIIRLNGTDNLHLNGLVLNAACNYAWGVHLMGDVQNVTLANNTINLVSAVSNYIALQVGIVAANSETNPQAAGGQLANLTVNGNTITNGYYGVKLTSASATLLGSGIVVSNNTLVTPMSAAIDLRNVSNPTISGNQISMRTGGGFGSLNSAAMVLVTSENGLTITGNKVTNAGNHGLYLQNVNRFTTTPGLIANNMIGGGFQNTTQVHAVQLNNASYLNIYHNSTLADNGATGSGMYVSNQFSRFLNMRNNSFSFTGPGAGYALQANNGNANFTTLDNNNYYTNGFKFVRFAGADRQNLAQLQLAPGPAAHNMQSLNQNPLYVSNTNLHLQAGSPLISQASAIAEVTTDYDGDTRTTPTDIGADEYTSGTRAAGNSLEADVYPNPFHKQLVVKVSGDAAGDVQVTLTDLMGRQVLSRTFGVAAGTASLELNLNQEIAQGVYLLQVTQGEATAAFRVVKQ